MNIALVLSGGTGTRVGGDIPKQYITVGDKPVLSYCLERLSVHPGIDAIQIVAAPEWQKKISLWLPQADTQSKFHGFSNPGENRQLSIYHGLEDIRVYAGEKDFVLIHDAARPLLSSPLITDCLNAVSGHDGVLPVLPMKDTVYVSTDGKAVSALLKRSEIYAGQAPEVFQIGSYYEANKQLLPDRILKIQGSTEPAILAGLDVVMIPGDEHNFKITTKEDLRRFEAIVAEE